MKIINRLAAIAFLFFLLTIPATAQMGRLGPPHISGVWNPIVGAGAAYEVDANGKKSEMEIAIIGKESVGGKDAYWYEMSFDQSRGGGQIITKTLMVIDGSDTQVSRMIMQMPNRPPMEMDTKMMHQDHAHQPADIRTESEDVGSETITVPAGTFVCEHYRSKGDAGDTWVSQKVSPYGMVKHQSKDSIIVLTKVIDGAKDKITGTPVPFNPQAFMQQQPQQ